MGNSDKSGKFKKYSYMDVHHPKETSRILEWAKNQNCYGLPFDELSYLYGKKDDKFFKLEDFIYKEFRGSYKGYGKFDKYKNIEEKFLEVDLVKFKNSITDLDIEKQKKCGFITQKIMENYLLMCALNKKYQNMPNKRIMIHCFLNGIEDFPECEICGKTAAVRQTNSGFRKTCSEKCRRKKEQSYKSYFIKHEDETIRVQGYERFVIPEFLKKYARSDLKIGFEENDPIEYFFDNRIRDYYPDLLIVSENRIVEVKSEYSFLLEYKKNIAKKQECLNRGFGFEFHIWCEKQNKTKII